RILASAPFSRPLLIALPLLVYVIYPPEIKRGTEVPVWAGDELNRMGKVTKREIILSMLVLLAIVLWVFGGELVEPATAALVVISLMLIFRVVTWPAMAHH